MLSPLHFWLVFVATGGLLVLLAWLGSRRRRLNPREIAESTGEVGCGHCGYDARGLPSDICPECGSDLNQVGRIAPQFRRWQRVPPLLRGLVFAIVVLLLAAMLGGLGLGDHVPYRRRMTGTEDLRLKTLTAADGSLLLLPIAQVSEHWHASGAQIRTSDVQLLPSAVQDSRVVDALPGNPANGQPIGPPIARLELDGLAGRWTITQGGRQVKQGTTPIEPEDVLFFLLLAVYPEQERPGVEAILDRASSGLDADRVQRDEARRLLSAAAALYADAGLWTVGTSPDDDRYGSPPYLMLPLRWRGTLPAQDFYFSYQGGGTGELMYVTAGGDVSWRPSLRYAIPMVAFWLLVLVLSVFFATRRRSIRPRRVFVSSDSEAESLAA